jgi:hypothetical protein
MLRSEYGRVFPSRFATSEGGATTYPPSPRKSMCLDGIDQQRCSTPGVTAK